MGERRDILLGGNNLFLRGTDHIICTAPILLYLKIVLKGELNEEQVVSWHKEVVPSVKLSFEDGKKKTKGEVHELRNYVRFMGRVSRSRSRV